MLLNFIWYRAVSDHLEEEFLSKIIKVSETELDSGHHICVIRFIGSNLICVSKLALRFRKLSHPLSLL